MVQKSSAAAAAQVTPITEPMAPAMGSATSVNSQVTKAKVTLEKGRSTTFIFSNLLTDCAKKHVTNDAAGPSTFSSSNPETTYPGHDDMESVAGAGGSEYTTNNGGNDNSMVGSEDGRTADSLRSSASSRGALDPSAVSFTPRGRGRGRRKRGGN